MRARSEWRIRVNEKMSEKDSGWVHIVSGYMWMEKKSSRKKIENNVPQKLILKLRKVLQKFPTVAQYHQIIAIAIAISIILLYILIYT